MNYHLLEIVACPVCNGKMFFNKKSQELICKLDALAFPVCDEIPVLLESKARVITLDEIN